jgi:hypothetical protein
VDVPNAELNLADTSMASNDSAAHIAAPAPGTTSPIVAPGPELVQLVPVTTSESDKQPTPAAVIALSDLQMREGPVNLPPANETATAVSPSASDILVENAQAGDGSPASTDANAVAIKGVNAGPVHHAGLGNQPSIAHITLPKKGRFGAVVVGSPLLQEYPEMVEIWGDRMAYTVYLHVGLAKTWILQYSLPHATEGTAPGSIAPLQAPWPYDISRPQFAVIDFNANALVLHGFVNKDGRFESLALVYPPQFAQAEFVLYTLQRWQFRPARQNGRTAAVEVVLIVPNDME